MTGDWQSRDVHSSVGESLLISVSRRVTGHQPALTGTAATRYDLLPLPLTSGPCFIYWVFSLLVRVLVPFPLSPPVGVDNMPGKGLVIRKLQAGSPSALAPCEAHHPGE